jgi:hypothetical protein
LTVGATPQDFFFQFNTEQEFVAQTASIVGQFSDPHLWLYDSTNTLIAANDDWSGLNSYLNLILQPGMYRLRAGYCCGDPDAERQGWSYLLDVSVTPVATTTEEVTTTSEEPTTTVQETTIPTVPVTTTDPEPSTSVETTTTTTNPTTLPEPSTTSSETPVTVEPQSTPTTLEESSPSTTVEATTTTRPPAQTTTTASSVPSVTTSQVPTTTPTTTLTAPQTPEPTPTPIPKTLETLPPLQNLTDGEAAVLVQQLKNAPRELKKQFEQEVNVFSGQFDNYIPADQKIPVGERRTLIAVTASLVTLGATAPSRKSRG